MTTYAPSNDAPPHSIEAEACVIGSMVLEPAIAIPKAQAILRADDFFRPAHGVLFDVLAGMHDAGMPIDLVLLKNRLEEKRLLAQVGGMEYVVNLVEGVPNAANVDHYARIIRARSERRAGIVAGQTLEREARELDGDYIGAIRDVRELEELAADDRLEEGNLEGLLEDTITGKRRAIDWPWPMLSNATKALLPGSVTALCGAPESGKSFWLMQCMLTWHTAGLDWCCYELEDDRTYHLYRALSMLDGNSQLFDDAWIRANPDQTRAAYAEHKGFLSSFGPRIYQAPDQIKPIEELARWVEQQCRDGRRIIVIDPITYAQVSAKPWIDDLRFMVRAKNAARRSGASIVLATHPRGGKTGLDPLNDMAGGLAYSRYSHTALWLTKHNPPAEGTVRLACGPDDTSWNRTLVIGKARNGKGGGCHLAFDMSGETLLMHEVGLIVKKPKKGNT